MTDIFWDLDENKALLGRPRLLVVGDMMVDRTFSEVVFPLDPEREHQLRDDELFLESLQPPVTSPGGAVSLAMAWKAIGEAIVCGVVGDDEEGRNLTLELRQRCITAAMVPEPGRHTIVKNRFHLQAGPRVPWKDLRVDQERARDRHAVSGKTERAIIEQVEAHIQRSDAVAISDFDKGGVTGRVVKEVARLCRAHAKPLLVGPKHDLTKYAYDPITVISVDHRQAMLALEADRRHRKIETVRGLTDALRAAYPLCSYAVVKLGPAGAAYSSGTEAMRVTAAPVGVVHTVRAGDVFDAYLLAALLRGYNILEAMRLGNLASGIACTKRVFEWPDHDDVHRGIRGNAKKLTVSGRKILSLVTEGVVSTEEIAERKGVRKPTAATEIQALMNVLQVKRRSQLLPIADKGGLVTPAMKIRVEELDDSLKVEEE